MGLFIIAPIGNAPAPNLPAWGDPGLLWRWLTDHAAFIEMTSIPEYWFGNGLFFVP